MLVFSRQRDRSVVIGDEETIHVPLTASDRVALLACSDPGLTDLAGRLLAAERGPVRVEVCDIRGDKVRLGTKAARSIPVHRDEVYDAIRSEAAALTAAALTHEDI